MMLATRGLVILLVFEDSNKEEYRDLRNYIKGHARLIKLLKNDGSNDNVINWWWDSANFELYEDLLKQHGYLNNNEDVKNAGKKMTSDIGERLNNCKNFRENSSYDTYIIMAQHWRKVKTRNRIFRNFRGNISQLSDKILNQVDHHLRLISDVLVAFLNGQKRQQNISAIFPSQVTLYLSLINELYALLKDQERLLQHENKLKHISDRFISKFPQYQTNDRFSETSSKVRETAISSNVKAFLNGFGIPDRKNEVFNDYEDYLTELQKSEDYLNELTKSIRNYDL